MDRPVVISIVRCLGSTSNLVRIVPGAAVAEPAGVTDGGDPTAGRLATWRTVFAVLRSRPPRDRRCVRAMAFVPRRRDPVDDTCPAGVPAEFWPMFWSGSRGSDAVLPRDAFHVACTLLDCGDRAAQAGTIARGQVFSGGWCGTVTRRWTGRTQPLRATHSAAGRQDHPAAVVQGRPLFPSRCQ